MKLLALLLLCAFASADPVTLAWDSTSPQFALMIGGQSGQYDHTYFVSQTSLTFDAPLSVPQFAVVLAVEGGQYSDPSNELEFQLVPFQLDISSDLKAWAPWGAVVIPLTLPQGFARLRFPTP